MQGLTPETNAVIKERIKQNEEFGEQHHDPAYWYAIMGKQFGQLGEAVVDNKWADNKAISEAKMYHEATQVAAVAIALMTAIREGTLADEITTAQPSDPRQRAKALGRGDEQINYSEDHA